MQNQSLDTVGMERASRSSGVLFGAILAGCICGLLPLYIGRRIGRTGLGLAGFVSCVVSGGFFGFRLALPVAILFTAAMLFLARPESK